MAFLSAKSGVAAWLKRDAVVGDRGEEVERGEVSGKNQFGCLRVGFEFGQAGQELETDSREAEAGVKGCHQAMEGTTPGLNEDAVAGRTSGPAHFELSVLCPF